MLNTLNITEKTTAFYLVIIHFYQINVFFYQNNTIFERFIAFKRRDILLPKVVCNVKTLGKVHFVKHLHRSPTG